MGHVGVAFAIFAVFLCTGCANDGTVNHGVDRAVGTAVGGFTGGLLGSAVGGGSGRLVASSIGVTAGATLGDAIGGSSPATNRVSDYRMNAESGYQQQSLNQ